MKNTTIEIILEYKRKVDNLRKYMDSRTYTAVKIIHSNTIIAVLQAEYDRLEGEKRKIEIFNSVKIQQDLLVACKNNRHIGYNQAITDQQQHLLDTIKELNKENHD